MTYFFQYASFKHVGKSAKAIDLVQVVPLIMVSSNHLYVDVVLPEIDRVCLFGG